jgi:hypothetical protein
VGRDYKVIGERHFLYHSTIKSKWKGGRGWDKDEEMDEEIEVQLE